MPTRCNIIVQSGISGRNILYRHCDGYPDSGTGDDLKIVWYIITIYNEI